MSSYYNSFTYKNKDSKKDMNLIVVSFEPDDGFVDSFLSMDSIYEDNPFGTRRFSYGAKYNSVATIEITVLKSDGTEFSLSEFRNIAKWITGARSDSWLNMYAGGQFICSFLGKFIDLQSYKLDARTVGLKFIFESVVPWAFSQPQIVDEDFEQKLAVNEIGFLYAGEPDQSTLSINDDGVLFANTTQTRYFSYMDESVYDDIIYIDNTVFLTIDNPTDDLYTYINLDMQLTNENSDYLSIKNKYESIDGDIIEEETKIVNMDKNDVILLSAEQFITSQNNPKKVFGDDFNFVWPKLAPGINEFSISGSGAGNVQFTYRYPMKVGDCTMDIEMSGGGIVSCDDEALD